MKISLSLLQSHDKRLRVRKKTHRLVLMEDYLTAPGRYSKQYCQDHPDNELTHACGLCYKTFCVAHDNEVYTGLCPKGSQGMWREVIGKYGITQEIKTSSTGHYIV